MSDVYLEYYVNINVLFMLENGMLDVILLVDLSL